MSARPHIRGSQSKPGRQVRSNPNTFFSEMGTVVEEKWRDAGYDAAKFPEIAAAALARFNAPERIDPIRLLQSIESGAVLARQQDAEGNFSNLPLTVFNSTRFFIDIYFWLHGTTVIHQHAFAGAFQVLSGSSLHGHYDFRPKRAVSPYFAIGNLSLKKSELLSKGDIKQIIAGRDYIHSLFHLDNPSTTITIRSIGLPNAQPQFVYLKPGIAYDPFFQDPGILKRTQIANVLLGMHHPKADKIIKNMLSRADMHTSFELLSTSHSHLSHDESTRFAGLSDKPQTWESLLETVRDKHGAAADLFANALSELRRQMGLIERRRYITTPELRFLLALLLNVQGRKRILRLVRQRYPEQQPVETILDWVEELSRIKSHDGSTNALDLEGFDDVDLQIVECLMKGNSLTSAQAELRKIFRHESPRLLNQKTKSRYEEIQRNSILKPLFSSN